MRVRRILTILVLILSGWFQPIGAQETADAPAAFRMRLENDGPLLPIRDKDGAMLASGLTTLTIEALDSAGKLAADFKGTVSLRGAFRGGTPVAEAGPFSAGSYKLENIELPDGSISIVNGPSESRTVLPGWVTLLPPLVAIVLAFLTRQVLVALFCGVWVGATFAYSLNPLASFLHSIDNYIVGALADTDHATVILFSFALAGTIGVITHTGGIQGIVQLVSRWAKGPRSGQVATWFLGLFIFFDDYANSLIIGNTMRPFTDKVRVSREKLAFIVDSTAAPVATIGVISTWTAFQIGLVSQEKELSDKIGDPYIFFLESIPYSFYSILTLFLVLICGLMLKDFGPMRKAEERCCGTAPSRSWMRPWPSWAPPMTSSRAGSTLCCRSSA